MGECCKGCRFWFKGEPQFVYGYCRRYPPQAGFTFNVKPGRWGEGGEATISRNPSATEYPNSHETDWCGEFREVTP